MRYELTASRTTEFRASSAGPARRWHHVIPVKTHIFLIFAEEKVTFNINYIFYDTK